MSFHSPLTVLHRLRVSLERMAWLRLQLVHTQIAAASSVLSKVKNEKRDVLSSNLTRLGEGVQGADLRLNSVEALEFEEQRVLRMLDQLASQRRRAESEFMKSRRQREIVENAIELQRATYEDERNRREQAWLDDEILQRMTRSRANRE